ncbi:NAD(P)H-dependent glycerol-3-phosphate dehydrogenase [Sphingomonas sp.]|uniref:NAD(P)H-dependent glycerol-3-phosphate dehydrogenase n=1 Tax=Sphingomonas sp. TaxID=28214 RepID=UPI0035C845FF
MTAPLAVIGAGAWGTALAQLAAGNGHPVLLWGRDPALVAAINAEHRNMPYLPDAPLSPLIEATTDLARVATARFNLVVTPAQAMRGVLAALPARGQSLVVCCKGVEHGTHLLMSEVATAAHPGSPVMVLSGPTFAHELARGLPTAITLAGDAGTPRGELAALIAAPHFRPYVADDVIGAEIGGAVKNVLAIACGVVEGAALGQNARAALIARGFAEMTRFGLARGARAETLAGLSGLGDLVLTCSSTASRNYALGMGIGRGEHARELLANRRTVAEGAATAPALRDAARSLGVEMPITAAVCRLLDGAAVREVIGALLARPLREE